MAHPDMDALLNEGLHAAIYLLEKNGEFFPFGVTMALDGSITHGQGYVGDDCPPSQEIIELLISSYKLGAETGEYKSVAIISDVSVSLDGTTKSDAISVTIDHMDSAPIRCFLPYTRSNGTFEFGEIMAQRADPVVFARQH